MAKAEQAAKERANLASLKESFEVFDGDGNGTLDAEEVVETDAHDRDAQS